MQNYNLDNEKLHMVYVEREIKSLYIYLNYGFIKITN